MSWMAHGICKALVTDLSNEEDRLNVSKERGFGVQSRVS